MGRSLSVPPVREWNWLVVVVAELALQWASDRTWSLW